MEKAFAYLRVSGKGQVEGDGFTRQLEAIKKYAAPAGLHIAKVYREEGVSGTFDWTDRPAFTEMMTALLANGTRTVLIEALHRLARDLMVQEIIVADFRRKGITLISVAEPDLCSDDPSRVLMRQIWGAFAQYDKSTTVLKLRGARVRARATYGTCEGRKPYGSHPDHPAEEYTIERILSLRAAGMTMDKIAETLNDAGHKPRSGAKWHGSSVRNVLLRAHKGAK
jgi:DNA invertase Pin-like site-specific DNA recombinase